MRAGCMNWLALLWPAGGDDLPPACCLGAKFPLPPNPLPMIARKIKVLVLASAALMLTVPSFADVAQLQRSFDRPPDDAKAMVRWWWFGPAVTNPELEREMKFMKEGGFGGFEVEPIYPMALDDEKTGLKNLKLLSPEFFSALKVTTATEKGLGLRMNVTRGSG